MRVGSRKEYQSGEQPPLLLPLVLFPLSLRSHLPPMNRTILCTEARQNFNSVNQIIALSCLNCASGFPLPLGSSPDFSGCLTGSVEAALPASRSSHPATGSRPQAPAMGLRSPCAHRLCTHCCLCRKTPLAQGFK